MYPLKDRQISNNFVFDKNKRGCLSAAPFHKLIALAVGDVHRYFKAKTHFGVFGFHPHGYSPKKIQIKVLRFGDFRERRLKLAPN